MAAVPRFAESRALTLGLEIELQVLARHDLCPTPQAPDLLRLLARSSHPGLFAAKSTPRTLRLATPQLERLHELRACLTEARQALMQAAQQLGVALCGGGTYPGAVRAATGAQGDPAAVDVPGLWQELAPQVAVQGLHVHIGCPGPDQALLLMQGLSHCVPQLIALAASSPWADGCDSGCASARLQRLAVFPTSGQPPPWQRWDELEADRASPPLRALLPQLGDALWDLCPCPERGTVAVRVMDAPLSLDLAVALAGWIQCLARWLRIERPFADPRPHPLAYAVHRYQACRHGLQGMVLDPHSGERQRLDHQIKARLDRLEVHAMELQAEDALRTLRVALGERGNDAQWLRQRLQHDAATGEVLRQMVQRFEEGTV
jgi:glutamate---cysteine ligase / carboxylate-amine ligase